MTLFGCTWNTHSIHRNGSECMCLHSLADMHGDRKHVSRSLVHGVGGDMQCMRTIAYLVCAA